jgi:transcriptional regulator with XRE-family HTH domain
MNTQQTSVDFNQRVGNNVRRFREAAELSQTDLAEQLTHRGYAFQQQGVVKIEQGHRKVSLEESHVIAELLNVPPEALTAQMDERLAALEDFNSAEAAAVRCDTERQGLQLKVNQLTAEIARYEQQRQQAAQRLVAVLEEQGRPDLAQLYREPQPMEEKLAIWRELHRG